MIINDLKKKYGLSKVYDAAIRNQIDLVPRLGNRDLKDAFVWFKSPEGEEFWNYINNGDFHNAYGIIPDLFDEAPSSDRGSSASGGKTFELNAKK